MPEPATAGPLPSFFGSGAQEWAAAHPVLTSLGIAAAFGLAAYVCFILTRWLLALLVARFDARGRSGLGSSLRGRRVAGHVAYLVPIALIRLGLEYVPALAPGVAAGLGRLLEIIAVVVTTRALVAIMFGLGDLYARRPHGGGRSLTRYLQVLALVAYVMAGLVSLGLLLDRDPIVILTGVGAASAVLLLIFQNTILSFVAGSQLTSSDSLRPGDWIEMPEMNADGEVVEISLNSVTVQNWDKTLTIIPAHNFLGKAFKNWRGMQATGARRMKRSLLLDVSTIGFLTDDDLERLEAFTLLAPYLAEKRAELAGEADARSGPAGADVNSRRLTNVGTFRAYALRYLQAHPRIVTDMTVMVRQLQPGATGLPLELYAFVDDVTAVVYEGVQADVFDHLIAILPEFGLRLYQAPSGDDVRSLAPGVRSTVTP